MVDWAGDEEKVSPASRVFESTCAESRLPCHFKRAKGLQDNQLFAWKMSCFAPTWLLVAGHWTLNTALAGRSRLFAFQPSGRSSKPATEKKKEKKKQTRKACLAGGCRLPSPPRRQPRPRTPFPTQLPFWFPAGRCWIIGSHDRRDGVSLGWLWRGRRRRSRLGRSEFVPPRRTAERTRANFAIAELDLLSRTGPHILCLSVGYPRCVTGAVHPRPRSRSTRG